MNKNILLTADQMATSSTGLYHFTLELIKEIELHKPEDYTLNYFVPDHIKSRKPFGDVNYRIKNKFNHIKWKSFQEFDLVHFTHQHPTLLKPNKILGKKLLTIHDLNYLYEYPEDSHQYRHLHFNILKWVEYADQITTISHYTARDVAKHLNFPINKIKVIHNGVNINPISPDILDIHEPKHPVERPFLFTLGTVIYKKNFHVLPAILAHLDYDLVIAGRIDNHGIEYYHLLLSECKRFHISPSRIHIIGETSEIDKQWYYRNCSGFVFPSIAEGFGLPVLEAFYHQKPTFLSKLTALPEIGGDAAYYFTSFQPEEMSEVIKNGIADFNTSDKVQKALAILNQFSWEKAALSYLDLYEEMLNS